MKTKIKIKDLDLELMSLYFNDTWGTKDTFIAAVNVNYNKETGEEIGVEEVLTPRFDTVSVLSQWVEDNIADLGDQLCNAALFIEDEQTYEVFTSNEVIYAFSDFITVEQKKLNYEFYCKKLATANNWAKLKIVRESVLAGQKGKNGMFFFNPGESKEFWRKYNEKKNILNQAIKTKNEKRSA